MGKENYKIPNDIHDRVMAYGHPYPLAILYEYQMSDTGEALPDTRISKIDTSFFDKRFMDVGEAILTMLATSGDGWLEVGALMISANATEKTENGVIVTANAVLNFPIDDDGECKHLKMLAGLKKAYYEHKRIYNIYKTYFDNDIISPYDFITWALDIRSISVPKQMVDWKNEQDAKRQISSAQDVNALHAENKALRDTIAELQGQLAARPAVRDTVHPRERTNLLRIIGALVNDKLTGKRLSAKEIERRTEGTRYGKVSDDTINKFLEELEGITA